MLRLPLPFVNWGFGLKTGGLQYWLCCQVLHYSFWMKSALFCFMC